MKQVALCICLVVIVCHPIIARDRVQIILERYLGDESHRHDLLSNETFIRTMFQSFRTHHPRQYRAPNNEATHYGIFRQHLKEVIQSNVQKNLTFTVGLNKFSDWTPRELQVLRGNRVPGTADQSRIITMSSIRAQQVGASSQTQNTLSSAILTTFDYTTRVSALNSSAPIIGPVKDQGFCGSCYAFAIIALFEAQYAFHYGQTVSMSDQQIIDCSTGDFGCVGGYFSTSFNYVHSYGWYLDSNSSYPYKAVASTCAAKKSNGWSLGTLAQRHLSPGNASAMQEALINFGPLWVSLYVGSDCSSVSKSSCPVNPSLANTIMHTLQSYTGGIFQISGCQTSASNNNHAMVIVGYGHDPVTNLDYWKLRNSWGKGWGENGYIRIVRGVNMCNIESDPYFIAKPAI